MKGGKDTSGKASQRKGADGERELAAVLREYGYEIKRDGSMSFGEALRASQAFRVDEAGRKG